MISPGKITREEFDEALGRYPALITSISASKTPAKEGQGQLTLEQLDKYRFELAPIRYYNKKDLEDPKAAPTPLSHEDVVQLVKWKLKHGTFRPNLLKLAESNSSEDIKETTLDAFQIYKKDSTNPSKAIAKLTTLRGIGPATASLLLSVHDSARIPFFSDELYQWICHEGAKPAIKYSLREYEELVTESRKLIDRLEVDARDVEKVAFVLIHEASPSPSAAITAVAAATTTTTNDNKPKKRGRPVGSTKSTNSTKEPKEPKEPKAPKARKVAPLPTPEPTEMTLERKAQLQEIAEKARAARVAKREAKEASKLAKGTKFRERVDAARERRKLEAGAEDAETAAKDTGAKRKRESEVLTRGSAAAKRAKRSEGK